MEPREYRNLNWGEDPAAVDYGLLYHPEPDKHSVEARSRQKIKVVPLYRTDGHVAPGVLVGHVDDPQEQGGIAPVKLDTILLVLYDKS